MVITEVNATNFKVVKTRVTIGDSRTLTGEKRGNWHGYQRCDRKLHRMKLSYMAVKPVLHAVLLRNMRAQKRFPGDIRW